MRACDWLAAQEVSTRGDWAVRRAGLAAGGFPFEFANENYPDVDDTAVVVLALRRAGHDPTGAAGRGLEWMLGMQSRSGGFGAFDADNESSLCARLAFCDFGAVTDPPSSDVTAHVLETLAFEGRAAERPAVRALGWLLASRSATARGSGAGARTTSTGPAPCCRRSPHAASAGTRASAPRCDGSSACRIPVVGTGRISGRIATRRGAARRLDRVPDGLGAHRAACRRRGGRRRRRRAVRWLVETQLPDGGWDEPYFTGTGFPGDFYLNYHLYRDVFPVMALGRVLGAAVR